MRRLVFILLASALPLLLLAQPQPLPSSQSEAPSFPQQLEDETPAPQPSPEHHEEGGVNMSEVIFEHVLDSYEWHIINAGGKSVAIYLPVILCSKYSGWHVFSSKHIVHGSYRGFRIAPEGAKHERKIVEDVPEVGAVRPFDLSITKNVLSLLISSALLALIVLLSARWYRKHDALKESPKGVAGLMEPIIMMVHEMARENIGEEDFRRFSPYLIMAFCFIFFNNLLGIVPFFPGGANVTGNITITLVLALWTFIIVNTHGTKHYYKDIIWPDVPSILKPVMAVIEVFSAMMKPVSLTIRLFANMLAGHIQLLSIVCVIFIMAKYGPALFGSMSVVSVLFGIFLDVLELLISFIQAYVFTMLSSIYIGIARERGAH